ncbi:hypothetical protein [Sorangium sp. So ce1151]|uniref:hypothetical protein n=1 Tax=Sorangium sp. So ce1151 TaxID=3133332 RepID=UPI003F5EF7AD
MTVPSKQHQFLESLSARSLSTLDLGPRDAPASMSADELRRYLAGARLPAWDVLFELHAQLAGVGSRRTPGRADLCVFPRSDESAMRAPPLRTRAGTIFAVPVGSAILGGRTYPLLADERGALYHASGKLAATSARSLIEALGLLADREPVGAHRIRAALRPLLGARLAQSLGAEPVVEASDASHAFWVYPGGVIADGHPFRDGLEGDSFLWTGSLADVVRCIEAAREAAADDAGVDVAGLERLEDARPPEEAPQPLSPEERRARGAIRTLSEEPGQAGYVYATRSGHGVEIGVSREHAGRVLKVEQLYQDGCMVLDYANPIEALRRYLSDRTLAYYATIELRWNAGDTCSPGELAALFLSAGIELSAPIAAFERSCGGLTMAGLSWGIFSLVKRGLALREAEGPMRARLVRVGHAMEVDSNYYLDQEGTLYVDAREIGLPPSPVAASWSKHLERVFTAGRISPSRPFSLETFERAGEALADAFDVPVLEFGTDRYASVWLREDIEIYEQVSDPFYSAGRPRTVVVAAQLTDVVQALRVVLDAAPGATFSLQTPKPVEGRPLPSERPVLCAPLHDGPRRPSRRELRVYGRSGAPRLWIGESERTQ